VPYDEGGRLSELHDLAGEMEREDTPEGARIRAARVARGRGGALRALLGERRRGTTRKSDAPVSRACSDEAREPSRAHDGDAGFDLYAVEPGPPSGLGSAPSVGTGIALAIPEGWAGLVLPPVRPRDATTGSRFQTRPALIDSGL